MTTRKKPVVLVVDDDVIMLRAVKVALNRKFDVHTLPSPESIVQKMLEVAPDIVVTDLKMPRHNGFWVYTQVRDMNANVPVIFNSAYQDMLDEADIGSVFKPFGFVTKDGNLVGLVNTLTKAAQQLGWNL